MGGWDDSSNYDNTMFKFNTSGFWTSDFASVYKTTAHDISPAYEVYTYYIQRFAKRSEINVEQSIRPVISIDASLNFSSGNGTYSSPYLLEVD